jgi:hypothetical protein
MVMRRRDSLLCSRRISEDIGKRNFTARFCPATSVAVHVWQLQILLQFYRDYYYHTAADQNPDHLTGGGISLCGEGV